MAAAGRRRSHSLLTARKAAEFAVSIARDPESMLSILPLLSHPFSSNWDMGEPWWNPRAIRYLHGRLPPVGRVFEWGSGGSTVWLSKSGMDVTSVESERVWADRVRDRCPSATVLFVPGRDHGSVPSDPWRRDHGVLFYDDYVHAIDRFPDSHFDAIVVDGLCRFQCASSARAKVKPGGLVVLDDSESASLERCFTLFVGWRRDRIRGFKRLSQFVTETTFFQRPVESPDASPAPSPSSRDNEVRDGRPSA